MIVTFVKICLLGKQTLADVVNWEKFSYPEDNDIDDDDDDG